MFTYYILLTKAEMNFLQGEKQMLIQIFPETDREVTRQVAPGKGVTTVETRSGAANAGRWVNEDTSSRRQRRVRRMNRAESHRVGGWSLRTW
jgi:hypothetical protein